MGRLISDKFKEWQAECDERFSRLKANEERLNSIFIDAYGLNEELTPQVEDSLVSVRRADLSREIRSLISYAVGCMFGRYSPDSEGLIYAGGAWDESRYVTFPPVKSNVITVSGDNTEALRLLTGFIGMVYGEDTLEENLSFIASAIGDKGTPAEVIQTYLRNGFFHDHCKIYKKRPIYWLFDSGRKNGYKALVYFHRLTAENFEEIYRRAVTVRETLEKQNNANLRGRIAELEDFEIKLSRHIGQGTAINPDDGIIANYSCFQDVLAKIY